MIEHERRYFLHHERPQWKYRLLCQLRNHRNDKYKKRIRKTRHTVQHNTVMENDEPWRVLFSSRKTATEIQVVTLTLEAQGRIKWKGTHSQSFLSPWTQYVMVYVMLVTALPKNTLSLSTWYSKHLLNTRFFPTRIRKMNRWIDKEVIQ